jgi:hypothetical protein
MHVAPSASNRLNMTINYIILTLRISRQIDEVDSLQQWYDQHAIWYIDDLSQIYSHSTIITLILIDGNNFTSYIDTTLP